MSKILFWIGFVVLVYLALRKKIRGSNIAGEKNASSKHKPSLQSESMLRCAHCGVYFPASEAIHSDSLIFCCTEHIANYSPKQ